MASMWLAAVAKVTDGKPAVRFMALVGLDDLSLIEGTLAIAQSLGSSL